MRLRFIRFVIIFCLILICVSFCFQVSGDTSVVNNSTISDNHNSFDKSDVYEDKPNYIFNDNDNDILGFINIPKIDIYKELYNIDSKKNNVDKNIQVIKDSNMPDSENGNFILAAHSGFSSIAYFKNLYKLEIGDSIIINYHDKIYEYIIDDMYDVPKTGKVLIKRNKNKSTITLITCKGQTEQLVVIGYLR